MFSHRLVHYGLLLTVAGLLTLPNLGAHALWDMDEGVNVECSREMLESGSWIVPTFNWELRTAKPVMLYWLQRLSLNAFGVNEWAARFPSVLLGMGTVLLIYELGRRMFGTATGLLSGIVLASAIQFCVLSHAATPDAPLIFFTVLTLYLFWRGHEQGGRAWFVWPAVASGLAVLSKGPIGLGLPAIIVLGYFAWNRELKRALDRKLVWGGLVWALVALPWYILVTSETRGEYLAAFLGNHNVNRFVAPMEGHRGPPVYYVGILFIMFAPWCCFLGATLWYAVQAARTPASGGAEPDTHAEIPTEVRAHRFLICWFLTILVFFSAAATKLPNYIGPLYPAIALLTARFLMRWRDGLVVPPRWVMPVGLAGIGIVGGVTVIGMVIAGGVIPISGANMRTFPGLENWAVIGAVPLVGLIVMIWQYRQQRRPAFVQTLAVTAVAYVGLIAAFPPVVMDQYKAAKALAAEAGAIRPQEDIRLGSAQFFPESLVFYAQRRVEKLHNIHEIADFLATPRPGLVFVPKPLWDETLAGKLTTRHRIVATRYDFLKNAEILVVSNGY
ncbi:MAG: glycosyltransferase family 39 protein [Bacteroidales bacterium]|nr:glycosyltransferase family 39 protein [Bacteroidales bacterium]